eukprot:5433992-Alexandrium_andersonii.AAC.1
MGKLRAGFDACANEVAVALQGDSRDSGEAASGSCCKDPPDPIQTVMQFLVGIVDSTLPCVFVNLACLINDLAPHMGKGAKNPEDVLQEISLSLFSKIGKVWGSFSAIDSFLHFRANYMVKLLGRVASSFAAKWSDSDKKENPALARFLDNIHGAKQFVDSALDSVILYDQLNETTSACSLMWTKIAARSEELRGGTTHEKTEREWTRWENTVKMTLGRKKVVEIKSELSGKFNVPSEDLADLSKDALIVMATKRMRERQETSDREL